MKALLHEYLCFLKKCTKYTFFFIPSGPPGAGKSTTCQLMAKEAGYVYYEADCTTNNLNPFIGTDVENPTIAAIRQKPLKVTFSPICNSNEVRKIQNEHLIIVCQNLNSQ